MKNEPFVIERTYPVPVEAVWKAITDVDAMRKWYFYIADFKAEPGFEFSFVGEDHDNIKYKHLCKIIEVVENRKLKHSWRYEGYEGNSFVTWELFDEGEQTKVRLTHEGLETFPPLKAFAKENFAAGWNYIVGKSLFDFVAGKANNS